MSACVEQFASYVNVLENALNLIDDDVSLGNLGRQDEIVKILDTVMEVNTMLVYRFQCGPVPKKDMDDVRKKVADLLSEMKWEAQTELKNRPVPHPTQRYQALQSTDDQLGQSSRAILSMP